MLYTYAQWQCKRSILQQSIKLFFFLHKRVLCQIYCIALHHWDSIAFEFCIHLNWLNSRRNNDIYFNDQKWHEFPKYHLHTEGEFEWFVWNIRTSIGTMQMIMCEWKLVLRYTWMFRKSVVWNSRNFENVNIVIKYL